MKKRIVNYLWVGLALLFLSSCNNDDKEMIDANMSISIHGLKYNVEQGVIWHSDNNSVVEFAEYIFNDTYVNGDGDTVTDKIKGLSVDGETGKSGNFIVSIYEKGMEYDPQRDNTFGIGAMITIHFASPDLEQLKEGTYTYNLNRAANTFVAFSSTEYNLNETALSKIPIPNIIKEGTIDVKKDGDEYQISINCKTSTGSEIVGKFKGMMPEVDIRKEESVNYIDNAYMDAAFDTLKYSSLYYGWTYNYTIPDYRFASCVYNTSISVSSNMYSTYYLSESDKMNIDLALCYDKATNSVFFESPIRMRAKMWHGMYNGTDFLLPCHTKFVNAPTDFTASDFDAISNANDFNFNIEEDKTKIAIDSELPKIVLFETGNGLKGAIKITKITPVGEITYNQYGEIFTRPTNPRVEFEIKTPISPASTKLK